MSIATISAEVCERVEDAENAVVYLDFDGTLAPMVDRIEDARMPDAVFDTLAALARDPRLTVVIISGRSLADLRRRIGIPGLIYAGNHGFEITGDGLFHRVKEAEEHQPWLREALARLAEALRDIPGSQIEDKGVTASIHFRRVDPLLREKVQAIVRDLVRPDDPHLVLRDAKMVTEIRPRIEWDKGQAVLWIRRELHLTSSVEIYIGDDTTDEDAFRVLPDALTIHVGTSQETLARYRLRDPGEVAVLLNCIAKRGNL